MLTGLMEPSGGDAVIAGYSIRKDMPKIHRVMGVCPQHDLTWWVQDASGVGSVKRMDAEHICDGSVSRMESNARCLLATLVLCSTGHEPAFRPSQLSRKHRLNAY
eukprot:1161213-Pelagomonas_calceolata.AAC.16